MLNRRAVAILLALLCAPLAFADMTAAIGTAAGRTTNGTVDIGDSDVIGVDLMINFSSYATAADTSTPNNGVTIGFVGRDGATTTQSTISRAATDNQAADLQCSRNDDSKAWITSGIASSCANVDVADASAFPSDNAETLNYTTASGRARLLQSLLVGCLDCEARILKFQLTALSSAAVAVPHNLAGTPQIVFQLGNQAQADAALTTSAHGQLGAFDGTRYFSLMQRNNGGGSGNAATQLRNDKWVTNANPDYVTVALDTTNVTLTPTGGATTTAAVVYVAALYGPGVHAYVGNFLTPTSTGSANSITSLPFIPQGLVFFPTRMVTMNGSSTGDPGGLFGIGAAASTGGITQAAVASSVDDCNSGCGNTDSNDYTTRSNAVLITKTDGTVAALGAVTSIGTTVAINYTTVVGGGEQDYVGYVALQQDSGDTDVDDYTITDKTVQEITETIESVETQILGITTPANITIAGSTCEFDTRTNAGAYSGVWKTTGTIASTDWIKLHRTSSGTDSTGLDCTPTIGTGAFAAETWTVTTGDATPSAITFVDQTNVSPGAQITSACFVMAGLTVGAPVTCDVLCAVVTATTFSTSPGLVHNGECLYARHTAGAVALATSDTIVTARGVSDTFRSTVAAGANDSSLPQQFKDLCTDTNGVALASHTPTANVPAHAWVTVGSGGSAIQSNKCNVPATTISYVDMDTPNAALSAIWTTGAAGANSVVLTGRQSTATDYYRCRGRQDLDKLILSRIQTGQPTVDLGTVDFAFGDSTSYVLSIRAYGSQIACLVDGIVKVSAIDSVLNGEGWGIGTVAVAANQNFDDVYVMQTRSVLNSSGYVPDDPDGMLKGLTFGSGSFFSMEPTDQFAQHVCSAFDGGSLECDVAAFTGDDAAQFNIFDTTSNSIKTLLETVHTTGAGTQAPVVGQIPNQTCGIGDVITPFNAALSLTTVGQPTPTADLHSTLLPTGLVMSSAGIVTGTCLVFGTYTPTIRFTNATGNSEDAFVWSVTADTIVNQFHFVDVAGQTVAATAVSNCALIDGITGPVSAVIAGDSGCAGRANSTGSFTSPIALVNNDCLEVHVTIGPASSTRSCGATINGIADSFDVIAAPELDTTPNDFAYPPLTGVARSTLQRSAAWLIAGLTDGVSAPVTVSNGTYSKNGGTPTASAGTVVNGDTVEALHTSNAGFNLPVSTIVCVGTFCAPFTSTTLLGAAPVCGDMPTQRLVAGVGMTPLDASTLCSNATQYGAVIGTLPTGVVQGGAIFSGVPTIAGENSRTRLPISNAFGTETRNIEWHILAPDAATCHDETINTVIRGIVIHPTCPP